MQSFADLGLPSAITDVLDRAGITHPFPIQASSIPDALAGRDVCGRAPTGSGKTFAFGLPLLAGLDRARPYRPTGLVLVPTRELADQIRSELAPFANAMGRSTAVIYGGVGYGPQRGALRKGVDLVIACPGRLEDLLASGDIRLDDVRLVALDEADRMADMGFLPAVRRILDLTPNDRQTLLFSATLDGDVAVLTQRYQRSPVRHEAESTAASAAEVAHHFWHVDRLDRLEHTAAIVAASDSTIVFTRTRHGADRLVKQLTREGAAGVALHGGKSQPQRAKALAAFSSGRARALVATDVAARGIHVDDVSSVIHFDPPEDAKTYVHRSGRTARAGATGAVYSFVERSQQKDARRIIRELGLDADLTAPTTGSMPAAAPKSRPAEEMDRRTRQTPASPAPRNRGEDDVEGNVYVANLPYSMTSRELTELFAPFGSVNQATIVTHPKTTRSRGFGFVAMPNATRAITELDGAEVEGRVLTVREARPRR
ncbi:MAG TPA: DEAD/DEAH box helicase [Acidimicrobiia bacterium]|nr:DEAD/DEAH box helicase [Acidimicrobiia bacterium]